MCRQPQRDEREPRSKCERVEIEGIQQFKQGKRERGEEKAKPPGNGEDGKCEGSRARQPEENRVYRSEAIKVHQPGQERVPQQERKRAYAQEEKRVKQPETTRAYEPEVDRVYQPETRTEQQPEASRAYQQEVSRANQPAASRVEPPAMRRAQPAEVERSNQPEAKRASQQQAKEERGREGQAVSQGQERKSYDYKAGIQRQREVTESSQQQDRERDRYKEEADTRHDDVQTDRHEKSEGNGHPERKELEDRLGISSRGAMQTLVPDEVKVARTEARAGYEEGQTELTKWHVREWGSHRLEQNTRQLAIEAEQREGDYRVIEDQEMQPRQSFHASRLSRAATTPDIEVTESSPADAIEQSLRLHSTYRRQKATLPEITVTGSSRVNLTDQAQPFDSTHRQQATSISGDGATKLRQADLFPSSVSSYKSQDSSLPSGVSISLLEYKDAIAIVEANAQRSEPKAIRNFFDLFGRTGCHLNCREKSAMAQNFGYNMVKHVTHTNTEKKLRKAAQKEQIKQSSCSSHKWFTASNIKASSARGCQSCNILRQIFQSLFSGNEKELSSEYEYSYDKFEMKRRQIQSSEKIVETVRLFQPLGNTPSSIDSKKN